MLPFKDNICCFNFKHVQILPEQQNSIGLQAKQLTIGVNLLSSLWHGDFGNKPYWFAGCAIASSR